MHVFHGSCHCGNLNVEYTSTVAAKDAAVRACQCSFCRKHDARAISDPAGRIEITARDPALLERYQFGFGAIDFLICRKCGVYVCAYTRHGDDAFANVMVNVLDDRESFPQPKPVNLDGEKKADKRQRHRNNWTPAILRAGETDLK